MDIFEDTSNTLEIERFKAKLREIWARMLDESYNQIHNEDDEDSPSKEEYMAMNALKFADEPEPETELDSLMDMLDSMFDEDEELESVKSEGKAPTYGSTTLKSNNEKRNIEATVYEVNHKTTKTPSDSNTRVKSGSYAGTPSGKISKKKENAVSTKYSPLVEEIKDELRALAERQKIGRRKMRFRL